MKREEILNGNKLIAEFLNVKPNNYGDYEMYGVVEVIEDGENNQHFFRPQDMLFHSSWDWFMPVVDKIESIIFDENNSYNVTIGSTNYCVIQDANGDTIEIVEDSGNTKLETVYKAVVEFIKWYNENKI
jgi:hypothetical protein